MVFGDLKTPAGLKSLNDFLGDKSYIEGYQPSQADVSIFEALSGVPSADLAHARRWYNHIKSYGNETKSFPGVKQNIETSGQPASAKGDGADDDDDFELFGSDEETDEAVEKLKQERLAAYAAKKSTKPVLIAKSSIVLDVKPWDDETDMNKMEECVRSVVADGLLWGASKFVPLAYGIKKLQINCVVEDDKVGTDFLEEEITKFEDLVQSVDIAAFNKI
jgi:elongation factor 1-beta